jgi:hypothetical protein
MKIDTIIPLVTPDEIQRYVGNQWQTDIFKQSHDQKDGYIRKIVDQFSTLPCFFYKASDERLEKAHFSTWWRGMQIREYENAFIHDLYELHEIFHASTMLFHPSFAFEAFKRKMGDNELDASSTSEIEVYFRLPGLREKSFPYEIYADRFLNDPKIQKRWQINPDFVAREFRSHRQNVMMMKDLPKDYPDKPAYWIKMFTHQNEVWANTWVHRYQDVESAMAAFRDRVDDGQRGKALDSHIEWLISPDIAFGGDIPFPHEAEAFAAAYWANKAAYDRAVAVQPTPAPAALPAFKPG